MSQSVKSFSWIGPNNDVLVLNLDDGTRRAFPTETIETVGTACPEDAKNLELLGGGSYLHWPSLDFDLYVPSLLEGILGSASWMSQLGRRGGLSRSSRKAEAARINGRKGGRPCRTPGAIKRLEASPRATINNISVSEFSFSLDEFALAFTNSPTTAKGVPRFR